MSTSLIRSLAGSTVLSSLLEVLRGRCGDYNLVAHWQQGDTESREQAKAVGT